MTGKDWERAKLNVTLIFCSVCARACVFISLTPWLHRLGPRCWCGRYVVWFTVLTYYTLTHTHTHRDTCTYTVLSLNNMAVVLETLTKVSVEASKQCNKREEKNQSTRQLTPVQNTVIHSANQFTALGGSWGWVCSMLCLSLSRNDGLRMLGNLSSVFLTTGPAAGKKKGFYWDAIFHNDQYWWQPTRILDKKIAITWNRNTMFSEKLQFFHPEKPRKITRIILTLCLFSTFLTIFQQMLQRVETKNCQCCFLWTMTKPNLGHSLTVTKWISLRAKFP